MSSRNAYLGPRERRIAGQLNVALKIAIAQAKHGDALGKVRSDAAARLLGVGFNTVDYVEIRDAATLERLTTLDRPARILAAVKIGDTRLIDNMAI